MIRNLIKKFSRSSEMPPVAPLEPLQVIGDVHGRADLLARALEQSHGKTVFVGDYIDRGEDSADVLQMLKNGSDVICLAGNHEEMLLRFLADPDRHAGLWLRNGGLQTLASFGVRGVSETSKGEALTTARDQLAEAMGQDMIAWLEGLPNFWVSGNIAIVHAGADPALPMSQQSTKTLRWGHPAFAKTMRSDGIWVAHGHTIVDSPQQVAGRISVDTGAYATGRLSMASINDGQIAFTTFT